MDTDALEGLGLSKREAKAYLALLELGSSTTGSIIEKTGIPSSKIYEVLERLKAKGLASYVLNKHRKYFQAADPEFVLNYYNEKKKRFEEILPGLKEKQRFAHEKQEVEIYEGKQAIFKMLRDIVEQAKIGDEYLSFSLGQEHADLEVSTFFNNLALRRIEKGLKIRVLSPNDKRSIVEKAYSKEILKKINNKYTDVHYPQGIIVLNKDVVMLEWDDRPTAVKITSEAISGNYKEFFNDIYKKSKP